MKRFTISLYDVAADYESKSWIAMLPTEADAVRSSLKTLGFPFSEDPISFDEPLFDILVSNAARGYRTVYSFRTKNEVESIVDRNLTGLSSLPQVQAAALSEFLVHSDDSADFTFNDVDIELSVERTYSPAPPIR